MTNPANPLSEAAHAETAARRAGEPPRPMSADDYQALMDLVQNGCRVFNAGTMSITDEDLAAAARVVECADAVGWVVDPTAYRTALGDRRLERQRALIKAVVAFRASMRSIEAMR